MTIRIGCYTYFKIIHIIKGHHIINIRQLFFYYKRMNLPRIPNTNVDVTEDVYVLPLPDDELEFGYNIN